MATDALLLEAQDYANALGWRWVLKEPSGKFLADHTVQLQRNDPKYAALLDLPGWLWTQATADERTEPDRRRKEEQKLLDQLGDWISERVLGPIAEKILRHGRPASPRVVQVLLPRQAESLLLYPSGGRPRPRSPTALAQGEPGSSGHG